MQSVTLPNSITTISAWMLSECRLSSVTIPASVTNIGPMRSTIAPT